MELEECFLQAIKQEPPVEIDDDYPADPEPEVECDIQIKDEDEFPSSFKTSDFKLVNPKPRLTDNRFNCSICSLPFDSVEEKCIHFNKMHPFLAHSPLGPRKSIKSVANNPGLECNTTASSNIKSEQKTDKRINRIKSYGHNSVMDYDWKELRDHLFLENDQDQPETEDTKTPVKDTVSCDHCGLHYVRKSDLRRHILKHLTGQTSPPVTKINCNKYTCKHCDQKFNIKQSWRRHVQMHEMPNCFKCNLCERSFYRNDSLKDHLRTHTRERSYDCLICGLTYMHKANHRDHIKTHPEAEIDRFYPKPHKSIELYTCEHCGQQFNRKYHWRRHTDQHEKPRSHKCEVCGKTYQRAEHLKNHRLSHI